MNIKVKGNQKQKFYLPDEYTQLNYIESTGTQYIDTGYKANQKTEYEVEFSYSEMISSSNGFVLGSRISSNSENISLTCDSGTIFIGRGNKYTSANITTNVNQKYIIKVVENSITRDGTVINNIANEFGDGTGTYNVRLFNCNQNGQSYRTFKGKIYYCKIWDNGELVREFIPCKRNSDSVLGMYDTVNNVFYTNAGSGSFTAGQEQKVSPDYIAPIETVGSNINLFDKDLTPEQYYYDNNGNKVEDSASLRYFINQDINITKKQLTISFSNIVGSNTSVRICEYKKDDTFIKRTLINTNNYTINLNADTDYIIASVDSDTTKGYYFENLKIEPGNQATPYSPYNMGSVEIDVSNKNFLKFIETDKTQSGLDVVAINNSIEVSGTSTASITLFNIFKDIKLKQGTYTFSFKAQNPPPANSTQFILCKEDGSRITTLNAWGNTNSNTITLEEDIVISSSKSYFYVNKNITFSNTKYELQIEKGESATEIIEPQSQRKIMYTQQEILEGDYIEDVEHHGWGKVILDGENIKFVNKSGTLNNMFVTQPISKFKKPVTNSEKINMLSNYFKAESTNNIYANSITGINIRVDKQICVGFGLDSTINTIELANEWLKEHNVIAYAPLETPLDLELTEEQKKVKDTPSYTYEGKTYIDNDSIAILEINYGSENIPLGNYIIPKPDSEEAKEKTNFVGYDYMIKFNNPYQDRVTYPISVGDYFENLCDQVGLEAGNIDFVNSDYMILGNPFTNNEDCRTVLSNIAQLAGGFARIGRDNKVYVVSLSKDINETIDGNNYFTDFSKNNKWGEVNSLVLRISGTEGENTVIQDEESIEENGLTEIVIEDNYFLIDQTEREKVIIPLWNSLKGLNYLPISTEYYGYPYLDSGDGINILDTTDTEYSTYIFNHTFKFNGGFDGQIDTPAMTKTQTAYKNTIDSKTRFRQVERKIDKVNGVIEDVIEEQTDFSNKLTQVEQTVDEISQKVEDIEDVTQTIEGTKTITLTNCVEGDLLELNIYGNNTVFDYLYPSNSLYPSDTLYPYGDSRLVVADENGNSITYELGVTEVLRRNGDICDEYVLKDGQAKVIRRINKNGTIKTTEEIEELGEFAIKLANGSNTITIKNYTGQLLAKYAIQNEYTDVFATKVEMQSSIDMSNEQINIELNKKVDNDKIIASINLSTEKNPNGSTMKLRANKISLEGLISANNNFKIDLDGNMKCNNANIKGNIQAGSLIEGSSIVGSSIQAGDYDDFTVNSNGTVRCKNLYMIDDSTGQSTKFAIYSENQDRKISFYHSSIHFGKYSTESGTVLTLSNYGDSGHIWCSGTIEAKSYANISKEDEKENILKLNDNVSNKKVTRKAVEIIKDTDICEYNFKGNNNTSIGLVIGDGYKTPEEVLSENKSGVDLYSMVSLSWKAIQELLEIINKQGQEIQELKERTNTLEDIIKNNKNT